MFALKRKLDNSGEPTDEAEPEYEPSTLRRSTRLSQRVAKPVNVIVLSDTNGSEDDRKPDVSVSPPKRKASIRKTTKAKGKAAASTRTQSQSSKTLTKHESTKATSKPETQPKPKAAPKPKAEKTPAVPEPDGRLRKYRTEEPPGYVKLVHRATNQRMFIVSRERIGADECPQEKFTLAGSTGNVYTVTVGKIVKCTCPHAVYGNFPCKHTVYVMKIVLRAAPALEYQLGLIPSELHSLFNSAPALPEAESHSGNRKAIEDDDECPICYMELGTENNALVYCQAACGNNFHKECFGVWTATKQGSGMPVTCPLCRTPWQEESATFHADLPGGDSVRRAISSGQRGREGYVNIGDVLGLSQKRDVSTYGSNWKPSE